MVLSMEWVEEVKTAMKMMKSACSKNNTWLKCKNCPFDAYCDVLEDHGMLVPEEWDIED